MSGCVYGALLYRHVTYILAPRCQNLLLYWWDSTQLPELSNRKLVLPNEAECDKPGVCGVLFILFFGAASPLTKLPMILSATPKKTKWFSFRSPLGLPDILYPLMKNNSEKQKP